MQGTVSKLEKEIKSNQVRDLLEQRPDVEDLEKANILPEKGKHVAPMIQVKLMACVTFP